MLDRALHVHSSSGLLLQTFPLKKKIQKAHSKGGLKYFNNYYIVETMCFFI